MAIKLEDKPGVQAPNVAYPFGRPKDNLGSNDGMPLNVLTHGDFHQFFAKMMDDAGISYNGLPDNATDGFQYFLALQKVIDNYINLYDDLSSSVTAAAGITVISKKVYKWKNKKVFVEFSGTYTSTFAPTDILTNLPKPIAGFKPEFAYLYGISAEDFSKCILYNFTSVGKLKNLETFSNSFSAFSFSFFYQSE